MRVAVVGAGSAGVTTAWLLHGSHEVTLYEGAARVGGHVYTVSVDVDGRPVPVELGAEFFFREGYRGLHALLDRMGIRALRDQLRVSISLGEGATPVVVPPRDLRTLATCLPPRVARDLVWLWRVGFEGERVAQQHERTLSVEAFLARSAMPRDVAERLLLPLIASSWGVTLEQARALSAYNVVRVMGLRPSQEAHSYRLPGGFVTYLEALLRDAPKVTVRTDAPVDSVDRDGDALVVTAKGERARYDAVVLACDWRNSAAMCAGSAVLSSWREAFAAFEDYPATVAVHRDRSFMPASRHHWGASNYRLVPGERPRTTVWSGRPTNTDVFRTWMRPDEREPASTTHVARYRHILCTTEHPARQEALAKLQGLHGLWAAGMYTTGIDNHESAVRSAVTVAQRLAPDAERVRWLAPQVDT